VVRGHSVWAASTPATAHHDESDPGSSCDDAKYRR
jgi:hypothetical protein